MPEYVIISTQFIIKWEGCDLFTAFILENNLLFEAAAHAGHLFRSMFLHSEIALKSGCAATITGAIINYTIAPSLISINYIFIERLLHYGEK